MSEVNILREKTLLQGQCHYGFPDLIQYGGKYFLSVRKGFSHLGSPTASFILESDDGWDYKPHSYMSSVDDIRDGKFFINDKNELVLIYPKIINNVNERRVATISRVICPVQGYSTELFTGEVSWRPKRINGELLFPMYKHDGDMNLPENWGSFIRLKDRVIDVTGEGRPSEMELFSSGGKLYGIVRLETENCVLASSSPPYKKWNIKKLNIILHGQSVVQVNDAILVFGREVIPRCKSAFDSLSDAESYDESIYKDVKSPIVALASVFELNLEKPELRRVAVLDGGICDLGYTSAVLKRGSINNIIAAYYKSDDKQSEINLVELEVK